MSRPVSRLLRESTEDGARVLWFRCQGCKHMHAVCVQLGSKPRPCWEFNGDVQAPTFAPSVHVYTPQWTDDEGKTYPQITWCHSYVQGGRIQFLDDCAHELLGWHDLLPFNHPEEQRPLPDPRDQLRSHTVQIRKVWKPVV
jgi:hypothetical protein